MHIYSVIFRFDDSAELLRAEGVVARWLSQKTRAKLNVEEMWAEPRRIFKERMYVDVWRTAESGNTRALRLSHPDERVAGRQWVTEVGVNTEDSRRAVMTLSLRTEESSAMVPAPVQVTRPKLVADLVSSCKFAAYVPGQDIKRMSDAASAEAVRYVVSDEHRNYAIVVVSATDDGKYFIDPERLRQLLAGVAEVVIIPPDADTFAIEDVLGNQFRSWLGAVNIIFPLVQNFDARTPPNRKILPPQLEDMIANGVAVENEILTIVTHRINLLNIRQHISPDHIHALNLRNAIETTKRHAATTGEQAQYVKLVEQEMEELQTRLKAAQARSAELEETLFETELKLEEARDEFNQIQYYNDSLKTALRASGDQNSMNVDLRVLRSAIYSLAVGDATTEQILQIIQALYPDRLVVLDTAWKSAREAHEFRHPRKLFERLRVLAGEYWDAMVEGKGDGEAGKAFGDAYSARESERVETNNRARELRTFEYKGVPIEMWRHVKIGVKDSTAETARVHFHWDAADQKVVIGHCGHHLDHG